MKRVFALLVGAMMVYEVVAFCNGKKDDTITEIFAGLSEKPVIPFLFGLVCGHLFWRRER